MNWARDITTAERARTQRHASTAHPEFTIFYLCNHHWHARTTETKSSQIEPKRVILPIHASTTLQLERSNNTKQKRKKTRERTQLRKKKHRINELIDQSGNSLTRGVDTDRTKDELARIHPDARGDWRLEMRKVRRKTSWWRRWGSLPGKRRWERTRACHELGGAHTWTSTSQLNVDG